MAKKRAAEHADERWLLTYADMITLLMALFMVLFSIAVVNKGKFDELAKSLRESFAGPLGSGANAVLQTNNPAPANAAAAPTASQVPAPSARYVGDKAALKTAAALDASQERSLRAAQDTVRAKIAALKLENQVSAEINAKGLVIRFITGKEFFAVGSATLNPASAPVLDAVAKAINVIGANPIRVEGYTDAIPFASDPHGNEQLAGDRADSVLFYLEDHGFSTTRHPDSGATSFGERMALVPNDRVTGAGPKNRRVEVVVQRLHYSRRAQEAANGPLGTNPVGLPTVTPVRPQVAP